MKIAKNKPEPLYVQIKNMLLSMIENGRIKSNERVPSEDELSAECKVSRMTARQALSELEKDGIIYRVPGKGTFLREKKDVSEIHEPNNICVYLSPLTSQAHPFFLELIEGIEHQLKISGLSLTVSSDLQPVYEQSSPKGIILVKKVPYEIISELEKRKIPFVLIYEHKETYGKDFPCILIDGHDATFKQTEYLIKSGHKKIALFTGELNGYLKGEGSRKRLKGYKLALEKHGMPFIPELIKECDYDAAKTKLMTEQLFLMSDPPTAIIACDDIGAGIIINTLKAQNIDVPADVAVVGVGDYHLGSMIYPPLTTFKFPTFEIGERAVILLNRIINNKSTESLIRIKGELVARESA